MDINMVDPFSRITSTGFWASSMKGRSLSLSIWVAIIKNSSPPMRKMVLYVL